MPDAEETQGTTLAQPVTSRDRVLTALDHREPDRVPFDLGATFVTGIHAHAYVRLREYLGLPRRDPTLLDIRLQLASVDRDVLERLGVDAGLVQPDSPSPESWKLRVEETDGYRVLYDEYGMGWQMPVEGGFYYDLSHSPLAGDISVTDVFRYPWPDPTDPSRFGSMRQQCESVVLDDQRAAAAKGMTAGLLELSSWMRGIEQFLMDLVADERLAARLLDKVLELKLAYWEKALGLIGDIVDVVMDADDYGSQRGPLISPDTFRRLFKPRLTELYSYVHAHSRAKVFLHSCGSIGLLIPDLIETGVDILNPIQVSATDMDTAGLKREFGRELVFWGGGVDTQRVLPRGTPDEVADEVRRRLDDLMPGGGFVFNTVHNIQADVPPENIMAMWDAVQRYGVYDS